jgi:hypothetical protein
MKTSNTISVSFDKSDFKDLLILEMVNYMYPSDKLHLDAS